jgi:hypothetical protein
MPKTDHAAFEAVTRSEQIRRILNRTADIYDEMTRVLIQATYDDPEINNIYESIRTSNSLHNNYTKSKVHREIIRFPNGYVADFIMAYLTPKYGENWIRNKKQVLKACKNEELLKPWVLYPYSKI